ncbi:MAG: hypothetical protein KDA24_20450 [Deltaproteobacteria bacterium]|nr:hypothetical protein [Deltaproteobacteria bacterium]
MAENGAGEPGDQALCESWAEDYGLTFPVLADPGWGESNKYEQDFGIPTFHLLGRDLTIRTLDGFVSAGDIEAALAEPVPEVSWDEPPSIDDEYEGDEAAAPVDPVVEGTPFTGGEATPFGGCSASVVSSSGGGAGLLAMLAGLLAWRRRKTV